jgi:hypothetical protein
MWKERNQLQGGLTDPAGEPTSTRTEEEEDEGEVGRTEGGDDPKLYAAVALDENERDMIPRSQGQRTGNGRNSRNSDVFAVFLRFRSFETVDTLACVRVRKLLKDNAYTRFD